MATDPTFDVIIVGSGPSGAHAAAEAVGHNLRVGLIDIGDRDETYAALVPPRPFNEVRRTDPHQHRYFLGDAREGISVGSPKNVPHITPPRAYMVTRADALLPLESDNFVPIQSTARGGLAVAWGGNCFAFEDSELQRCGLPAAAVRALYPVIARAIGVSADVDDLTPFIGGVAGVQPPLDLDTNARSILTAYERRRQQFHAHGFYLGRSMLAALSRDLGSRRANPYHDMDYWSDHGESVYRPEYTLRELAGRANYRELSHRLVVRFEEPPSGGVRVVCRNLTDGSHEFVAARKLILAAGALGSARLALSSSSRFGVRVPLLCNPNRKLASVNLRMLGRPASDRRHSLSQLTMLMKLPDDQRDYLTALVYSYRSLLLFRLVQDMPLPPRLALQIMRVLGTSLTIINVHHSDRPSPDKWIELIQSADGERLRASYALSAAEAARMRQHERRLYGHLARLGCIRLSTSYAEHGGSVHYVGTLPYASDGRPLTCDEHSRLRPTRHVFVADGSSWTFLPSKGLTFTLMANARRVAAEVAREIEREKLQAA